jgi:hypothetical protein
MKIDDIAKQLSNKVNQEHYIKHYLERVQRGAYKKGVKDTEAKQLETKSNCTACGVEIKHKGECDVCDCKGLEAYGRRDVRD